MDPEAAEMEEGNPNKVFNLFDALSAKNRGKAAPQAPHEARRDGAISARY
jgi:hypothetical protein